MTVAPYLNFAGNCEEAFKFYAQVMGGEIEGLMRFGEAPGEFQSGPGSENLVMHVGMKIGDSHIMASDCPPEYFEKQQGISVMLGVDTVEEAERIFGALSEGGTVRMPMEETFWAKRFGMVVDRFGTPWMINAPA